MPASLTKRDLRLSVGAQTFDVPRRLSKSGSVWWVFSDPSGDAAYRGIEIDPTDSSLPDYLTLEGEDLRLEAVPKYDAAAKTALDETHPFEKTRRFHGRHVVEGVALTVQARITVKKNGKWNLSFRAWGADQPLIEQEPKPPGGLVEFLEELTDE